MPIRLQALHGQGATDRQVGHFLTTKRRIPCKQKYTREEADCDFFHEIHGLGRNFTGASVKFYTHGFEGVAKEEEPKEQDREHGEARQEQREHITGETRALRLYNNRRRVQ